MSLASPLFAESSPVSPALPEEAISAAEIQGLLAKLGDLQSQQDRADRAALGEALTALRAASGGSTEAVSLYVASVRVVEFDRAGKKQVDFDEWKKKNDEKLHDVPFGQMLAMQYGFLKLALESDTPEKRRAAAAKLVALSDDYMRALSRLGVYGKSLWDDPFQLPVAKRYALEKYKPEGWPGSPLNLASVYAFIMKPVRLQSPKDLPALWESRIKQERALYAVREDLAKSAARKAGESFGKKPMKFEVPERVPEVPVIGKGDKFEVGILPKLQWEMGEDLYRSGLRRRGIDCLFTVIAKNPEHPSRADWIKSLAEKAEAVAEASGVPASVSPALPVTNTTPPAVPSSQGDEPPLPSA